MSDSLPSARYSPICNVLRQWKTSLIPIYKYKKTFKNEQRNRDDTAKKRVNTSGVGESNNYYEDIYNIYTSLQQHSLMNTTQNFLPLPLMLFLISQGLRISFAHCIFYLTVYI